MANNRVLVVDDDPTSLKIITTILKKNGYEVNGARDGQEAVELFRRSPAMVVISDLEMPKMDGMQLIKELRKQSQNTIMLVETAHFEPETIINIMKQGVFDYILKPLDADELIIKVEKAFEVAYFRELQNEVTREYNIRLDNQLTWNAWKESIVSRDRDRFDRTLFENLKTILTQGAGFGGLISILSLITSQPKDQSGNHKVDAGLMELVMTNANMAQKAIDSFSEIDDLLNSEPDLQRVSVADIYDLVEKVRREMAEKAMIKKQKVSLSELKDVYSSYHLYADLNLLQKALEELLVNAMKFSPEQSSIYVLMSIMRNRFVFSVLNPAMLIQKGVEGIPDGYENNIFEPFFRFGKSLDERYDTLDFGLGLTVVDKIVRLHSGEIRATNVTSHLNEHTKGKNLQVKIEIEFPLEESTSG